MFRIIPETDFLISPWKNGGGITHEIARDNDGDVWRWRLSLAEVAKDGPFSRFDGLSRILTVIEGAGIDLDTPLGALRALPLQPVAFSGELPVDGRLLDGKIRDLNVIFDPRYVAAKVSVLNGPATAKDGPDLAALVCLTGSVAVGGRTVLPVSCALGVLGEVTVALGCRCILVSLCAVQTEARSAGKHHLGRRVDFD